MVGWVAHRPGSNSVVACLPNDEHGVATLLASDVLRPEARRTVIRTFPELPAAVAHGQALFNADGSLLVVWYEEGVILLRFPSCFGTGEQLGDALDDAQLQALERGNELTLHWQGPNDLSPVKPALSWWGMTGTLLENGTYKGDFIGEVKGHFELKKLPSPADVDEWRGPCELTQDQWNEGEWPLRLTLNRRTRNASVGRVSAAFVDPIYLSGLGSIDVCWHPMSLHHLCVLDRTGQLRVYNCSELRGIPESIVDFASSPSSGNVIRIGFMDNNGSNSTGGNGTIAQLWSKLTLFALCDTGAILGACPVGNPAKLRIPSSLIDEARAMSGQGTKAEQERNYLRVATEAIDDPSLVEALLGKVAIQVVCEPCLCPLMRYPSERSGATQEASAIDFSITRITVGRNEAMIHRTWSSGHLDVVFWADCELEPWWRPFSRRLQQKGIMNENDHASSSSNSKSTSISIGARLKTMTRYEVPIEPPPAVPQSVPLVIKCLELWKTSNDLIAPHIFSTLVSPFVFVCVDVTSGRASLLKATWAEHPSATGNDQDAVKVDVVAMESLGRIQGRRAMALFCEDLRPLPIVVCVEHPMQQLRKVELARTLRTLNSGDVQAVQQLAQELTDGLEDAVDEDVKRAVEMAMKNSREHETDLERLRSMLDSFRNGIKSEIGALLVDQQPENNEWTGLVLDWLHNYYTKLMVGEGNRPGMYTLLEDAHNRLEEAKIRQRETVNRMIQSLRTSDTDLSELEKERQSLRSFLVPLYDLVPDLRESVIIALGRAQRLRPRGQQSPDDDPSPVFRALTDKGERLVTQAGMLLGQAEQRRAHVELQRQSRGEDLRRDEAYPGIRILRGEPPRPNQTIIDDRLEEATNDSDRVLNELTAQLDSLRASLHTIRVIPNVLFIARNITIDTETSEKWTDLRQKNLPFRVLVHTSLFHGRSEQVRAGIPLQLSRNGILLDLVVLNSRDITIVCRGVGDFCISRRHHRDAAVSEFVEVLPMVLRSPAPGPGLGFERSVFGVVGDVDDVAQLRRRVEKDGVVSCYAAI